MWVAVEGANGATKTSVVERLKNHLDPEQYVFTREINPDLPISQKCLRMIETQEFGNDQMARDMIFTLARRENFTEVIYPAILAGKHIVSDRSVYSMFAYSENPIPTIMPLAQLSMTSADGILIEPTHIVYLHGDTNTLIERVYRRDGKRPYFGDIAGPQRRYYDIFQHRANIMWVNTTKDKAFDQYMYDIVDQIQKWSEECAI